MRQAFFILVLCAMALPVSSQSEMIDSLLSEIESLQAENHEFYNDGLFPTTRKWELNTEGVEDNTILYSAMLANTLVEIKPLLSQEHQEIALDIVREVRKNYKFYSARKDDPTFNFWQTTEPDLPFPNGSLLLRNEYLRLPDDLLTSTQIYATAKRTDIDKFKEYLTDYAGRADRKKIKTTFSDYQDSEVYEILFADKMKQSLDLVVTANALSLTLGSDMPMSRYDSASIEFIKALVQLDRYLNEPVTSSPFFQKRSIIIYYLAKLVQKQPVVFSDIKEQLIADALELLQKEKNGLDRVLISSGLLMLDHPQLAEIDLAEARDEAADYHFFSTESLGKNTTLHSMGLLPSFTWTCPAYNLTILLEYLCLAQAIGE